MSLLNKDAKKKPLKIRSGAGGDVSPQRPAQRVKAAPCATSCPNGNDIRGWLVTITQRQALGLDAPAALDAAFARVAETNPFPAVMGRICTAPCEAVCNRTGKDGAVNVNATERLIGDWAIERNLALPRLDAGGARVGKVAVVGAGPAGLSCAYQLARRGHAVTLIEAKPLPGGSLRTMPEEKLSANVLDFEIGRLLALGIELRASAPVQDLASLDGLRSSFDAVCVTVATDGCAEGEEAQGIFRIRATGELPAHALAEGKRLALMADATLRGLASFAPPVAGATVGLDQVKRAAYEDAPRGVVPFSPDVPAPNSAAAIEELLLAEAKRCYSCGQCYDCERCFLYCQNTAFEKLPNPTPGHYYKLKLEACNGCKKCFNMCPCGCLDWV